MVTKKPAVCFSALGAQFMRMGVPGVLTSCRQVYWTWYGATFSSPLISTLM